MRFDGKVAFVTGAASSLDRRIPPAGTAIAAAAKLRSRGQSENNALKKAMPEGIFDDEFTTVDDVAVTALLFTALPGHALSGSSMAVSCSRFLQ